MARFAQALALLAAAAASSSTFATASELDFTLAAKVTAGPDAPTDEDFAGSLAVSADGLKAIVGAPSRNNAQGGAYALSRLSTDSSSGSDGDWVVADLSTPAGLVDGDTFGDTVATAGDFAAITAPLRDVGEVGSEIVKGGEVFTYTWNSDGDGTWGQPTQLPPPAELADADKFGSAVAISSSVAGGMLVVSTQYEDVDGVFNVGSVFTYLFDANSGTWQAAAGAGRRLVPPIEDFDGGVYVENVHFGRSMALTDEGRLVVSGGRYAGPDGLRVDTGGVWTFEWDGSEWVKVAPVLQPSAAAQLEDGAQFGNLLVAEGDRLVVNAKLSGGGAGRIFTFTWDDSGSGAWQAAPEPYDTFAPASLDSDASFGNIMALSGDALAVTARSADDAEGRVDAGLVYMLYWNADGGHWQLDEGEGNPIEASPDSERIAGSKFGNAVALAAGSGVTPASLLVGRKYDNALFTFDGTAAAASAAPTASPVAAPVAAPVAEPPTDAPSAAPSTAPSTAPTASPVADAGAPVAAPVAEPPTDAPSAAPTASPVADAGAPVAAPVAEPPTDAPSAAPSAAPSTSPATPPPTENGTPTALPTEAPTSMPSTPSPTTLGQTEAPSGAGGGSSTDAPTSEPTLSPNTEFSFQEETTLLELVRDSEVRPIPESSVAIGSDTLLVTLHVGQNDERTALVQLAREDHQQDGEEVVWVLHDTQPDLVRDVLGATGVTADAVCRDDMAAHEGTKGAFVACSLLFLPADAGAEQQHGVVVFADRNSGQEGQGGGERQWVVALLASMDDIRAGRSVTPPAERRELRHSLAIHNGRLVTNDPANGAQAFVVHLPPAYETQGPLDLSSGAATSLAHHLTPADFPAASGLDASRPMFSMGAEVAIHGGRVAVSFMNGLGGDSGGGDDSYSVDSEAYDSNGDDPFGLSKGAIGTYELLEGGSGGWGAAPIGAPALLLGTDLDKAGFQSGDYGMLCSSGLYLADSTLTCRYGADTAAFRWSDANNEWESHIPPADGPSGSLISADGFDRVYPMAAGGDSVLLSAAAESQDDHRFFLSTWTAESGWTRTRVAPNSTFETGVAYPVLLHQTTTTGSVEVLALDNTLRVAVRGNQSIANALEWAPRQDVTMPPTSPPTNEGDIDSTLPPNSKQTTPDLGLGADAPAETLAVHGDTIVVGASLFNATGRVEAGAVLGFSLINNVWTPDEGGLIAPATLAAGDHFGRQVSVYGARMACSAIHDDTEMYNDEGGVFTFRRNANGTAWVPDAKVLRAPDSAGRNNAQVGKRMAMHSDRLAVTSFKRSSVFTYHVNATSGEWQHDKALSVNDMGLTNKHKFGTQLGMTARHLVVSATAYGYEVDPEGEGTGAVLVYTRIDNLYGGRWKRTQLITPPEGADWIRFGATLAISDDSLVIRGRHRGADPASFSVAAYTFDETSGLFQLDESLVGPDGAPAGSLPGVLDPPSMDSPSLGRTLTLDGNTMAVVALGPSGNDSDGRGSEAYILTKVEGRYWKRKPGALQLQDKGTGAAAALMTLSGGKLVQAPAPGSSGPLNIMTPVQDADVPTHSPTTPAPSKAPSASPTHSAQPTKAPTTRSPTPSAAQPAPTASTGALNSGAPSKAPTRSPTLANNTVSEEDQQEGISTETGIAIGASVGGALLLILAAFVWHTSRHEDGAGATRGAFGVGSANVL